MIVGIVLGVFLGMLFMMIVAVVLWKRNKKQKEEPDTAFSVELIANSGVKM